VVWLALGYGKRNFEAFCPFGGVEAAWGLFRERAYTCSLSEMNVAMLIGVLGITILAGKAFCGWLCPVGLINEFLYKAGRRLPWLRQWSVPLRWDRTLRLLRYPVLIVMTVLTWKAGELLLRGYDPYFLIFSGFGHGSLGVISWITLVVILLAALVIPMFWCRALCPLGAVMDALSRFGILRVERNSEACTSCGACDQACLQRLSVSDRPSVASIDCTRCLDCTTVCPTDALAVRPGLPDPRPKRLAWGRVPLWAVPVPVIAVLLVGFSLNEPLTLPTAAASFYPVDSLARPAVATCTVEGVKCRGTAGFFIRRVSAFAGVAQVKTYAGLRKVEITFDQARITPAALRDSIDAPVVHPTTGEHIPGVFQCTEMKVKS